MGGLSNPNNKGCKGKKTRKIKRIPSEGKSLLWGCDGDNNLGTPSDL